MAEEKIATDSDATGCSSNTLQMDVDQSNNLFWNREETFITDAINIAMRNLRKKFCEDGTMDRLKAVFEEKVRNIAIHQKNHEKMQQVMSSGRNPSYEEVFKELGGPNFKVDESDDLDEILKKLVKMEHISIPEEEKEKLFKQWSELINPQR